MVRIISIILTGLVHLYAFAQMPANQSFLSSKDTLNSLFVLKDDPSYFSVHINHRDATLGNKLLRGTKYVVGYNISMGSYLLVAPEYVTKWNKAEKFRIEAIRKQYKESYSLPPVFDKDLWVVNYMGHPYQGSFYYNAMRSQGAGRRNSALFCIGQSILWEYLWEAGMEQPSVQDLITTPIGGILIGELTHFAAVKMSKNGFRWYEAALVCLINPTYAINNGFRKRHIAKQ